MSITRVSCASGPLRLELRDGEALCLLGAAGAGFFAFVVTADEAADGVVRRTSASVRKEPALAAAPLVVKLVGPGALLLKLASAYSGAGLPIAAQAVRASGVTVFIVFADGALSVERPTPTRAVVVDDSPVMVRILSELLQKDGQIVVVGSARDAAEALTVIEATKPDVATLDLNMPDVDGVELMKMIAPRFDLPCVIVSALSPGDGPKVVEALQAGAVDYVTKPAKDEMEKAGDMIREKVLMAHRSKGVSRRAPQRPARAAAPIGVAGRSPLVAIGSSTGGVQALTEILSGLPDEPPPIVIAQHIPASFSAALATRLDGMCPFEVKEAEDGDEIRVGRVLFAPGGRHLRVAHGANGLIAKVSDDDPVNRHRPSVDVLMRSVAQVVGAHAVGVILTGMGRDGAEGLLAMRQAGAATLAQDEASSLVYGMPRAANEVGAAEKVVALGDVAHAIMDAARVRSFKSTA